MSIMYGIIAELCTRNGIKPGKLCSELGISRGTLGDLKAGRTKTLSMAVVTKIANYFGVTTDYLLGEEVKKAPADNGKRSVSREELKIALFRGREDISEAMVDEVLAFADLVALREEMKKTKE